MVSPKELCASIREIAKSLIELVEEYEKWEAFQKFLASKDIKYDPEDTLAGYSWKSEYNKDTGELMYFFQVTFWGIGDPSKNWTYTCPKKEVPKELWYSSMIHVLENSQ